EALARCMQKPLPRTSGGAMTSAYLQRSVARLLTLDRVTHHKPGEFDHQFAQLCVFGQQFLDRPVDRTIETLIGHLERDCVLHGGCPGSTKLLRPCGTFHSRRWSHLSRPRNGTAPRAGWPSVFRKQDSSEFS